MRHTHDPTRELGVAGGVKEQVRRLLNTSRLARTDAAKMLVGHDVLLAETPETTELWGSIAARRVEIEVLTSRRDQLPHRGCEHNHQEHQPHLTRVPHRRGLSNTHPPCQRRKGHGVSSQLKHPSTLNREEPMNMANR